MTAARSGERVIRHLRWVVPLTLAASLAAAISGGASRVIATTTPTTPAPHPVLVGSYTGVYGGDLGTSGLTDWLPRTQALHAWSTHSEAVSSVFASSTSNAGDLSQSLLAVWTKAASVPMLAWWVTNSDAQNAALASGKYDAGLRSWASVFRTFLAGPDGTYGTGDDRRLYLRPDPEANGDWYGFSPDYGHPGNSAFRTRVSNFVGMWRHLFTVFRQAGLDRSHLAFVFSVNNGDAWRWSPTSVGGEPITEDIFPGTAYVDWVGIDGYNKGYVSPQGWQSPDQVFDTMITRLTALAPTVPLGIDEVGVLGTVLQKSSWISSYFQWLQSPAAQRVQMSLWFNCTDSQNNDYSVFGRTAGDETFAWQGVVYPGYSSYRNALANSWLVGSSATNLQLLTDAQFLGS